MKMAIIMGILVTVSAVFMALNQNWPAFCWTLAAGIWSALALIWERRYKELLRKYIGFVEDTISIIGKGADKPDGR